MSLFTSSQIIISSDIWSENDGRLGLRLCEEKNEEEESNEIQRECCACEEAKYEVMFQVIKFLNWPNISLIFFQRTTQHFMLVDHNKL